MKCGALTINTVCVLKGRALKQVSFHLITYDFNFESACLLHAEMYSPDIPHTISAGLLRVCLYEAIYRSHHISMRSKNES